MKKKYVLAGSLVFICLAAATLSLAQDTIKTLPPVTVKASTKKIPAKVWYGFSNYFSAAENPRWYDLNKDYLAKFMIYNQENRALFTKKGKLIYHISYGHEKSLPAELSRSLIAAYPGYEIYRAIKISEGARVVWVVNLQDAKDLVMVSSEDGEMQEIQRLKKSK